MLGQNLAEAGTAAAWAALDGVAVGSLDDRYRNGVTFTGSGAARPLWTTAAALDGRAGLVTTFAAAKKLGVATGGVAGAGAFWMAVVGKITTAKAGGYLSLVTMGTNVAGSCIGSEGEQGYIWLGRYGNGNPIAHYLDDNVHLVVKVWTGAAGSPANTVLVYVDGDLVLTYEDTTGGGPSNAAGMYFGNGINGATDGTAYAAHWSAGAPGVGPDSILWRFTDWVRRTFPSLALDRRMIPVGNSITAGTDAGTPSTLAPNNWPSMIGALLPHPYDIQWDGSGTPWPSTAVSGWKTSDMLAAFPTGAAGRVSALCPCVWIVVFGGTNNLFGTAGTRATDAPTAYADLAAMTALGIAAGARVLLITPLRRTQTNTPATFPADRAILRSLILANTAGATAVLDLDAEPRFDDPDNAAYFQTAISGVHLNIVGEGILAQMLATLIGPS